MPPSDRSASGACMLTFGALVGSNGRPLSQYSTSTPVGYERAWGGALVLIVLVMVLNLIARLIGRLFAPAKGH